MNTIDIIEKQVEIYDTIQNRIIKKYGVDTPIEIIISIYNEVNKDIRMTHISEEKDNNRIITVYIRDGVEKTYNYRDKLREYNFNFDKEKKYWYLRTTKKHWDEIKKDEIFEKLKIYE